MSSLVVGVTGDLISPDGSYLFPDYSLEPLISDERVAMDRIPCVPDLPPEVLTRVDILVSVPMGMAIKRQSLRCATRTVAIVRVGVGYEDVDVDAMTEAGVALVVPSSATRRPTAVAAFTLILALATRLLDKHRLTLAGPDQWSRRPELRGTDLEGLTLGLIGCGHIGQDLIGLVKPLGLRVLVSDPAVSTEQAYLIGAEPVSLEDLLSRSDFVSLHCPLNSKTRHMIDERRLALMKSNAYLVNTARGGLVDQAALAAALCANRIAGAGLDVLEPEPPGPDDPILKCGNVVFSAHALNWTKGLDAALGRANVESIHSILRGEVPNGLVNPAVTDNPLFQDKMSHLGASMQDPHHRTLVKQD
jgi:D-3-phosphoglycerate dehydrogenase